MYHLILLQNFYNLRTVLDSTVLLIVRVSISRSPLCRVQSVHSGAQGPMLNRVLDAVMKAGWYRQWTHRPKSATAVLNKTHQ